jgi:hypothetical protein
MPTMKTSVPPIYQIKVTLLDSKPPIWRRLLVPADLKLSRLHDVLQAAMGWQECHLHEFVIGRERFGVPDAEMEDVQNERAVRVDSAFPKVHAKGTYMYDFGDGWEHDMVVEKVLAPEPDMAYPVCIGGKNRCPPEDCGGIGGYYEFLEAIGDPDHEQHEELREWIGGDFDPKAFSVEEVNAKLKPLTRRQPKN